MSYAANKAHRFLTKQQLASLSLSTRSSFQANLSAKLSIWHREKWVYYSLTKKLKSSNFWSHKDSINTQPSTVTCAGLRRKVSLTVAATTLSSRASRLRLPTSYRVRSSFSNLSNACRMSINWFILEDYLVSAKHTLSETCFTTWVNESTSPQELCTLTAKMTKAQPSSLSI